MAFQRSELTDRAGYKADVSLLDYWKVVVRHKTLVRLVTGVVFVASVFGSLVAPNRYASTATTLPPQQEGGLQAALVGGGLPVEHFFGMKGTTTDIWLGMLNSRTIWDGVIERFGLRDYFGIDTVDDARKELVGMVSISQTREGIISITVEDTDGEMAARLANGFVEELDRVNRRLVMTSGKRMRLFVEERLAETETRLTAAEDALKDFQKRNRAVKLDEQTKAIIMSIGSVKGRLIAKEVELKTLLSYATPEHPKVRTLRAEVQNLKTSLMNLEDGGADNPGNPHEKNVFIPTERLPALGIEYARLLREMKIQETLYELLSTQYELARTEEVKDSPTVQVLDVAKAPTRRSGPNRKKIVMLSTFAGGFFSVSLAFFMEYVAAARLRREEKE